MKNLYYSYLIIVLIILGTTTNWSQCNQQVPLQVINPSFEGPRTAHITPSPWSTCGVTPDTQPGNWGVNLAPSNGTSYVGFVQGGASWLEGASQQLSGNMIANITYTFTIDLAATNANGGGINPGSRCGINVYGGNSLCATTSLLWSSPIITNLNWQTYTVTFTPTQNFSHVYFRVYGGNLGYILVDNITSFIAQGISITSHLSGASENCAFILAGSVSGSSTDSVVISGNFVETPLTANLTGTNWTAHLTFNTPGTETITATSYYTVGGVQYCVFTTLDLTLSPPTSTFSAASVCINQTTSFFDASTSSGQEFVNSWLWDFGDGNTSTLQNPSHTYSSAGTYNVVLLATTNNNCTGTTTVPYVVNMLPIISPINDIYLNCSITSDTFIASGGTNYLWQTPTGTSATPILNIDYTNLIGDYIVTITDANGCEITDSSKLYVDTLLPISNAGIDSVITCSHLWFNLNGNNSSIGNEFNYSWSTNNGLISLGDTTTTPTVNKEGMYYLTVFNTNNSCMSTDSVWVDLDTIHPISFAGTDSIITCYIPEINLSGQGSSLGNYSYLWNSLDGNIMNGDTTLSPYINSGGNYIITVTNDYNGCSTTSSVFINEDLTATVQILDSIHIVDSIFGVAPHSVNYSWIGDNGTVEWNFGDNNYSTDSSLTHNYSLRGNYIAIIKLTDTAGCIDYDSIYVIIDGREIIFPNIFTPNGDGINDIFTFRGERIKSFECSIFNRWGQKVYSWNAPVGGWDGRTFAGKELPTGEYFYILNAVDRDGKVIAKKGPIMLMK